jgi:hypothetical protein
VEAVIVVTAEGRRALSQARSTRRTPRATSAGDCISEYFLCCLESSYLLLPCTVRTCMGMPCDAMHAPARAA